MKKLGYTDSTLYLLGKVALAAACVAALLYFFTGFSVIHIYYPCAFKAQTGLPCPGCGGTRSLRALVEGNFFRFLYYYPPMIIMLAGYVIFMIKSFIGKHFGVGEHYKDGRVLIFIYICVALCIIQWVVKIVALFAYGYDWFDPARIQSLELSLQNHTSLFF